MLGLADEMQAVIEHQQAFYFAIWFHDAVQLTGKDSEGLSASLACKELAGLGVPQSITLKVSEFILATKHHEANKNDDAALFLDIDLSILAASQRQYQAYASGCRKEYSIPNFVYRHGRKKFLNSLKKRAFIFNTQLFQASKERIARENIEWELQGL
jgi:predicted metal-dependent HD superfamily phosphohydrolase